MSEMEDSDSAKDSTAARTSLSHQTILCLTELSRRGPRTSVRLSSYPRFSALHLLDAIPSDALPLGLNKAPDFLRTGFTGRLTLPTKFVGPQAARATLTSRRYPSVIVPKIGEAEPRMPRCDFLPGNLPRPAVNVHERALL